MEKQLSNSKKLARITLTLALVLIIYLAWYLYHLQNKPFPTIESVYIFTPPPPYDFLGIGEYVLSPDGSAIYNSFQKYFTLDDGKVHDNMLVWKIYAPGASEFISMSPDGRFMTAANNAGKYLLDLEQGTYKEHAFLCASWARDGSRCIDINGDLIEIPENRVITDWPKNVDFRRVKKVSGNGKYLWDEERRIPIAYISPCPIRNDATGQVLDTWCKLKTPSLDFHSGKSGIIVPLLEVIMPDSVVGWTFDPSGTYVLFAIWERKPGTYLDYGEFISPKNVTDTRFVLVNWRTKRKVELGRLSNYGLENVAASWYGQLQWSANGSTILVPLVKGQFVVLKVKYP